MNMTVGGVNHCLKHFKLCTENENNIEQPKWRHLRASEQISLTRICGPPSAHTNENDLTFRICLVNNYFKFYLMTNNIFLPSIERLKIILKT